MAVTREEIIKALKVIRNVCNENDCYCCPLRDDIGDCILDSSEVSPNNWVLNTGEEWRAILND